jgi:imidazolonepropionase-like amidohydrolase
MPAILAFLLLLAPQAKEDLVAFKFGKIVTVTQGEISPGIILVEHGKIKKIGRDVAIPTGAKVVDLSNYTAMPGLVDAAAWHGIAGSPNEETAEITPQFRIVDSIDPRDKALQQVLQIGVTTLHIEPGNRNVIGGLGSVFKPRGRTVREMLVREDVALKVAVSREPAGGNFPPRGSQATFFSRRPTTRMGVYWEFRKAFLDASKAGKSADAGQEILVKAIERKLPVRVSASRSYDIETALRLAEEFGLSIQLEEAEEAHKYVKELAERKIPVALRPTLRMQDVPLAEGGEGRFDTFATLVKAGVPVALLHAGHSDRESMLVVAAFAVKHGASREDALRAVTIIHAEMLGVSNRVGSLEEGKDADFVVLTGDPLDLTSRIEWVFIDGRRVFGKKLGDY